MKLYLAGPMRGYPAFNFPAFHAAAASLREDGHEIFSPADNDIDKQGGKDFSSDYKTGDEDALAAATAWTIRKALADDTAWICAHAEGIVMLPGWEASKGATAERALTIALNLPVFLYGVDI